MLTITLTSAYSYIALNSMKYESVKNLRYNQLSVVRRTSRLHILFLRITLAIYCNMEAYDSKLLEHVTKICDSQFPKAPEIPILRVAKNNDMAKNWRQVGNGHYLEKSAPELVIALRCYNHSICFAENDSEALSIGYSKRAAVYMELKMYEACLENIAMARSVAKCSARLKEKLLMRESECKDVLAAVDVDYPRITSEKTGKPLEPKLSFPPHPTIPFIANCLRLRTNGFGRHVVTIRDLKVGQIIAIEEPFCSMNPLERQYEQCENCHRENDKNLIPCKGCTFVMFCGKKCYKEAMQRYHKYECPIIDYLHNRTRHPNWARKYLLPFRMLLCALTSYNSAEDFIEFIESCHQERDDSVFSFDYSKSNRNVKSAYAPIHAMRLFFF